MDVNAPHEYYLLFVGETVTDHDILAIDFKKSFLTFIEAMAYYESNYDPFAEYSNPALIAHFSMDTMRLIPMFRTFGYSTHEKPWNTWNRKGVWCFDDCMVDDREEYEQ